MERELIPGAHSEEAIVVLKNPMSISTRWRQRACQRGLGRSQE